MFYRTGAEQLFPACVVNGTGVSKTFQILYRNEEVTLDDAIMFRAHILVDSHKVIYCYFNGFKIYKLTNKCVILTRTVITFLICRYYSLHLFHVIISQK